MSRSDRWLQARRDATLTPEQRADREARRDGKRTARLAIALRMERDAARVACSGRGVGA